MARPLKQGINYFSLDVDFFQDEKVRRIMKACGSASPTILLSLLCNIYRKRGYYIEWDDGKPFLIADEVGVSEGTVSETVNKAVQVGFFSRELFLENKILTSKSIQKRFIEATRQRTFVDINDAYWLLGDINEVFNGNNRVFPVKNEVNTAHNPQSKVKYISSTPSRAREAEVPNEAEAPSRESALIKHYLNHIQPDAHGLVIEQLCGWRDTFPPEVIMKAIDEAVLHGKRSYKYIETILRNWQKEKLLTLSLVEGHLRAWGEKKSKSRAQNTAPKPVHKSRFAASNKRDWNYDELMSMAADYANKKADENADK